MWDSFEYNYYANGRRTQKTVTPSGGSSTTTDYLSDGDHEVAEYAAGATTPSKRFIYGKNVDEIIAQHEPATNSYSYAHRNHQGSVVAVSKAGGLVASSDIYTYSPYGEPNIATGFPYRYTGRRLDTETGLYYYRARYYDAQLGRFLQTDPVGYEDQMNLYAYTGNDPVNKVDPTGKIAFLVAVPFIEGAAIGFTATEVAVGVTAGTAIAVNNEATESNEEVVSEREPGSDGKRRSTGGPGAGKRFKPETPEVKEAKEGVPCRYCGTPTTNEQGKPNSRERDHIDPKSRDGNNSSENEGDACRTCNRSKGARTPDEWQPPEPPKVITTR